MWYPTPAIPTNLLSVVLLTLPTLLILTVGSCNNDNKNHNGKKYSNCNTNIKHWFSTRGHLCPNDFFSKMTQGLFLLRTYTSKSNPIQTHVNRYNRVIWFQISSDKCWLGKHIAGSNSLEIILIVTRDNGNTTPTFNNQHHHFGVWNYAEKLNLKHMAGFVKMNVCIHHIGQDFCKTLIRKKTFWSG